MPNERGRRLRDREEVCLETRDDKDVGELDWAEYKRRRRPREKLGAVPDLDRDRCGRLTSMSKAEDVTMWVEALESIMKMPGTEFFIAGTAAVIYTEQVRAVVDIQLGDLSPGDVFGLCDFGCHDSGACSRQQRYQRYRTIWCTRKWSTNHSQRGNYA
jgi:hypothetical protein